MNQAPSIPTSHMESLLSIENGYWWYLGRLFWAQRLVARALPGPAADANYADIGCGTGGFAAQMQQYFGFARTLLVDSHPISPRMTERFRDLRFEAQDITRELTFPFPIQVASCMDVIEHLADDRAFLQRLYRALPEKSALVLSVPAFPSLFSDWDRRLGHHRRYVPSELRAKLKEAGFQVRALHTVWSYLYPIGWIRKLQRRGPDDLEFPPVTKLVNGALTLAAKAEWYCLRHLHLPFGTSLIASATK